jgi:hypothetical protein
MIDAPETNWRQWMQVKSWSWVCLFAIQAFPIYLLSALQSGLEISLVGHAILRVLGSEQHCPIEQLRIHDAIGSPVAPQEIELCFL